MNEELVYRKIKKMIKRNTYKEGNILIQQTANRKIRPGKIISYIW
jgi:hypothetical protein